MLASEHKIASDEHAYLSQTHFTLNPQSNPHIDLRGG